MTIVDGTKKELPFVCKFSRKIILNEVLKSFIIYTFPLKKIEFSLKNSEKLGKIEILKMIVNIITNIYSYMVIKYNIHIKTHFWPCLTSTTNTYTHTYRNLFVLLLNERFHFFQLAFLKVYLWNTFSSFPPKKQTNKIQRAVFFSRDSCVSW